MGTSASPSSPSLWLTGTVSTAAVGGAISLIGDSMQLHGAINAGSQNVSLAPQTNGTFINLGGSNSPGTLGLSSFELSGITAGTLNIGNAVCGTITVSTTVTLSKATNVHLATGGHIVLNPGSFNTDGGTLTLSPGSNGSVQPVANGVDVSVGSAVLGFTSGANLAIVINGTTIDTQYNQLNVAGGVNLDGVNLRLSGTLTPSANQTFTIVNDAGAQPLSGTFAGLSEGAVIPNFLGSSLGAVVTYVGGDGNDAVLTVEHLTSTSVTSSAYASTYGQPVTFNATVQTDSGTLPGSVEFFDVTTGADLGAGTAQNNTDGSAVWTYTSTPTQLQVTGRTATSFAPCTPVPAVSSAVQASPQMG